MAKIPETQINSQYRRSAIQAQQVPGIDLSPLLRATQAYFAADEKRLVEQARERAVIEQTEAGAAVLLQPGGMRYEAAEEAYRDQARAVHAQQAQAQAAIRAAELQEQYQGDPDGFRKAWSEYVDSTADRVLEVDEYQSAVVRNVLSETGDRVLVRLASEQANLERANQQQNFLTALDTQVNAAKRQMIESPNEEALLATRAQIGKRIMESGALLTQAQKDTAKRVYDKDLNDFYVSNYAEQAMRRGDVGAISAMASKLMAGALYDDPEDAQAAARSLQALLKPKVEERNTLLIRNAQNVIDEQWARLQARAPTDPGALNAAYNEIRMRGSEADIASADQKIAAMRALATVMPAALVGNRKQIEAAVAQLSEESRAGVSPGGLIQPALDMATKALEQLDAAKADPWLAVDPVRVGVDTPEEIVRAKEMAASRLGIDPKGIPPLSQDAIRNLDADVKQALSMRDPQRAQDLIAQAWRVSGMLAQVSLGEMSAPTALSFVLAATGKEQDIGRMLSFYEAGRQPDAARAAGLDAVPPIGKVIDTDDFQKLLAVMGGDPQIAASTATFLTKLYIGAEIAGEDGKSLVGGLFKNAIRGVTEMPNGGYLLNSTAQIPAGGGKIVKDKADEMLRNPLDAFGLQPDDPRLKTLQPVSAAPGVVYWKDKFTGEIILKSDGTPAYLAVPETLEEFRAEEEFVPDVIGRLKREYDFALTTTEQAALSMEAAKIEKNHKLPAGIMSAVQRATLASPKKELGGMGVFNLAPDGYRRRSAAVPGSARPADEFRPPVDQLPDAAGKYMAKMLKKYPDKEEALIAYAMGDDQVSALRAVAGDGWKRSVPQPIMDWVHRVMVMHER